MAKPLLADELSKVLDPLLPKPAPKPKGGRPPVENRPALTGILFVLKTGMPWADLPAEMGCGSGVTCWRRLRDWQEAGVWERVHRVLLDRLRGADKLDLSRAVVDSSSVRAVFGGPTRGRPRPTAARRAASTRSSPRPTAFRWLFD